ncbi:MAG: cache domain-containing protein [Gallionellaceae bacterium]|nr:cache domain-containing protein [Gallionellaceae bacterium]
MDGLKQSAPARAVVLLSSLIILVALAATITVLMDLRQRELLHANGELASLSSILSEQTSRTFEGVVVTMRGLQDRLSDDLGRSFDLDSQPVHLLLKARAAGLSQVKTIFMLDSHGMAVNSSREGFEPGRSAADREYFRHFAEDGGDDLFISPPSRSRLDGEWTFFVSARLLDFSGHFRGVLVASIRLGYFQALYDGIGLDFVSRIQLLDQQGRLLVGKPHVEEMLGTQVGDAMALEGLSGLPVDGVVLDSEESGDSKRFVAYRHVANFPLVISVGGLETDALLPWRRVMHPMAVGLVLVILFILATTYFTVRNLLRKDSLEAALKERDEQLRQSVQTVEDGIVTLDAGRRIILFNRAAEKIFGVRAEAALGKTLDEVLSGCLSQIEQANLRGYLDESWLSPLGQAPLHILHVVEGEEEFHVELSLSTTMFRGGTLLTAVFRDLTESERVERELLESNQQLQELSTSLQNVREADRMRISRELHDELGQFLTGIRMDVSWLGGRLNAEQQELVGKVASIKGQIDQTIASVRRISSELRPLVLDDLGFNAAAAWYVNRFIEQTGLSVTLLFPEQEPMQGGAVATALFRILQEALTNVARHARATRVEVRVSYEHGVWSLVVKDNGIGLATHKGRDKGLGLIGMRERVQSLGGKFSIKNALSEGTLIVAAIPEEIQKNDD